jgi:hypothetical protein
MDAQQTPAKVATLVWKTILAECKRPEESAPTFFYLEKRTEGDFLTLRLTEFAGPFTFTEPTVSRPTEAEKRNKGLLWSATADFRSTVYRSTYLNVTTRGTSGGWGKWRDTVLPDERHTFLFNDGGLSLYIERNGSGSTQASILNHPDATYMPIACSVAMSADPLHEVIGAQHR